MRFEIEKEMKPGASVVEMEAEIIRMEQAVEQMKLTAEKERQEEAERIREESEAPRMTTSQAVSVFVEVAGALRAQPQKPTEQIVEEAQPFVTESRKLLKMVTDLRDQHIEEFSQVMNCDEAALLALNVNPRLVDNLFRVARDTHAVLNSTVYVLQSIPKRAQALATAENARADLRDIQRDVARARELPEYITGALRSVRRMSSELAERLRDLDIPSARLFRIERKKPQNPDAVVVENDPKAGMF